MLSSQVVKSISFFYRSTIPSLVHELVSKDGSIMMHKDGLRTYGGTQLPSCTLNVLASPKGQIRDEQRAIAIRAALEAMVKQNQLVAVI